MKIRELREALLSEAPKLGLSAEVNDSFVKVLESLKKADSWELRELLLTLGKMRRPTQAQLEAAVDQWSASEYCRKLSSAMHDDSGFETLIARLAKDRGISRDDLVSIYSRLFSENRQFPKKYSKPSIIDEVRAERLARVRLGAA